jgi:NitT/TauT family transport system substrate-binding protein
MLALTGAAVAAGAVPAGAQSGPTIRFGIVGVEESATPYYAQEKGFFKQAGLNVQISVFPNGGSVTQGLAGGALDVGVTNSGSMSMARQRGLPIDMIACGALYTQSSPISHLVVGKNSGIRTAKDLAGKTVAVSTLRDMIQVTVLAWIDKNGGDSKVVNFTEIPPAQQAASILAHRIDGAPIVEPFYSRSRNDVEQIGLNYEAVNDGKPFQTLGIVGNKDWVAKNGALVHKLADALHAAARWANRNHDEAAHLLTAFTKIDPSVIAAYPRLTFAETNNASYIQPVVDMMARYAVLQKGFPAAQLFAPGLA